MFAAMVSSLHGDMAIARLDLRNNRIGDKGAEQMAALIEEDASLRKLHLQGNAFSEAGLRAIAKAMAHNTTLLKISVDSALRLEGRQALLIEQEVEANRRIDEVLRQQQSWQAQGWSGYPMDVLKMLEQSLARADIKLRDSITKETMRRLQELQLCLSNVQPLQNRAESRPFQGVCEG
jgi:hypothetical protein